MPDYGAISGGSGVSYMPSKPAKKKGKKKNFQFLRNLAGDISDAAHGIPAGLGILGSSIANDVSKLVTGKPSSFMLDDLATGMALDYKRRYYDTAKEDGLSGILKEMYNHPLAPIIDVATVFTGGGAAAGKVASGLVRSGKGGARAAKIAGYTTRTPESIARAAKAYGINSKQFNAAAGTNYIRDIRTIGANQHRLGSALYTKSSTNPYIRVRNSMIDKALDTQVGSKIPLIGSESRIARDLAKTNRTRLDSKEQSVVGGLKREFEGLSNVESTAVLLMHENPNLDRSKLARMVERNMEDLEVPEEKAKAKIFVDTLDSDEFKSIVKNPTKNVKNTLNMLKQFDRDIQPVVYNFLRSKLGEKAPEVMQSRRLSPKWMQEGAYLTREHPENLIPTANAIKSKGRLEAETSKRLKDLDVAQKDYKSLQGNTIKAYNAMLLSADKLENAAKQGLSNKDISVIDPKALKQANKGFDSDTVNNMIDTQRRKIASSEYTAAENNLKQFLTNTYYSVMFGTTKPSKNQLASLAQKVNKSRRRGAANNRSISDNLEHFKSILAKNPWDRKLVRLINNSPQRQVYTRLLLEERAKSAASSVKYKAGTLKEALHKNGIDVDNISNNADTMHTRIADSIENYFKSHDESFSWNKTILDNDQSVIGREARKLIQDAKRKGLLKETFTDNEASNSIAHLFLDDVESPISVDDFVNENLSNLLRVYEKTRDMDTRDNWLKQDLFDESVSRETKQFYKMIGLDTSDNIPTKRDFVERIAEIVEKAGFDNEYVAGLKTLRNMEDMFDNEGVAAFANMMDSPEDFDVSKLLFIDPNVRKKLLTNPDTLMNKERMALLASAQVLKQTAAQLYNNKYKGSNRFVKRIDRLSEPSPKERRLALESLSLEPEKLVTPQWVNPKTGRLYADETGINSKARYLKYKEQADAENARYIPHTRPTSKTGNPSRSIPPIAKGDSKLPKNLERQNTGFNYRHGQIDTSGDSVIRFASTILRHENNQKVLDDARSFARPFNKAEYNATGRKREWLVIPKKGLQNKINKHLSEFNDSMDYLDNIAEDALPTGISSSIKRHLDELQDNLNINIDGFKPDDYLMIPRKFANQLFDDIKESGKFARLFVDKPLEFFRLFTLRLRPTYYINNIVGNHFMLALKDGGIGFIPRYIKFLAKRDTVTAREMFRLAVNEPGTMNTFYNQVIQEYAPATLGASFIDTNIAKGKRGQIRRKLKKSNKISAKSIRAILAIPAGLEQIGLVLGDDLPRAYRFYRLMQPHIKDARRRGRFTGTDNEIARALLENDDVLRTRIETQVLEDLIDYRGLTPFEKKHMRRIIPFYAWLKGITQWSLDLGYNSPHQLLALSQLSNQAYLQNKEFYDSVPRFMRSAVQLGTDDKGNQRVLLTQGLNPLSTIGDLADMGSGFVGSADNSEMSQKYAGQVNPYIRATMQTLFNNGKEFGSGFDQLMPGQIMASDSTLQRAGKTGYDMRETSRLLQIPGTVIGGFPQSQIVSKYRTMSMNETMYGSPYTPQSVYASRYGDALRAYLGYPVKSVNQGGALSRRLRDDTERVNNG